jgi:hypothetical protein
MEAILEILDLIQLHDFIINMVPSELYLGFTASISAFSDGSPIHAPLVTKRTGTSMFRSFKRIRDTTRCMIPPDASPSTSRSGSISTGRSSCLSESDFRNCRAAERCSGEAGQLGVSYVEEDIIRLRFPSI